MVNKRYLPIIFVIVCLFVLVVLLRNQFLPNDARIIPSSANWNTFRNERFGIQFSYPNSLIVKATGPNSSQQQLDRGEEISGTVSPSYETYEFVDKDNNAIFYLEIFHENDTPLTVEGYQNPGYLYLYGKCDGRWLNTKSIPVGVQRINKIDVLEVKVEGNEYARCYYLKNNNQGLIVFSSSIFKSSSDFNIVEPTMKNILSTIEIYKVQE